uniref:Casein kinase I n=1 Tax=Corethron hystrix TaxID=216773 RepID=A0A6U5K9E4_9STRA|mmetsp:Transcript_39863/g.93467  ORF Transcript_39863/g.93467 Transcript_39863/m.93467 type:complete len:551 (+) Transcript_39863:532-2184(+)
MNFRRCSCEYYAGGNMLETEAHVLRHMGIHHPEHVPRFIKYIDAVPCRTAYGSEGRCRALVMELLDSDGAGTVEDMHTLRERAAVEQQQRKGTDAAFSGAHGRMHAMHISDAVWLVADNILPRLRAMHYLGMVHRDVKPSNFVRCAESFDRERPKFKVVDFGLSKSFVVPKGSEAANDQCIWELTEGGGGPYLGQNPIGRPGSWRKERSVADFRGTSMYASPFVHLCRDYAPRDDIFSAMYVFCDFVAGGLPWASDASARGPKEGDGCTRKREVEAKKLRASEGPSKHGFGGKIEEMLMGAAAFPLPGGLRGKPCRWNRNAKMVELLRIVFTHLGSLTWGSMPNYDLIEKCIRDFEIAALEAEGNDTYFMPDKLNWNLPRSSSCNTGPSSNEGENYEHPLAQMEYNAIHGPDKVPPVWAAHTWTLVATSLLSSPWDTPRHEGSHRKIKDGYRREEYTRAMRRCLDAALPFHSFRVHCRRPPPYADNKVSKDTEEGEECLKNKWVESRMVGDEMGICIGAFHVRMALIKRITEEEGKKMAPPPAISFSTLY